VSVAMVIPIIETYLHTGLVPRLPTAVLATGVMLLAFLSLASGLILDTVTRGRKEVRRLTYLSFKAPADEIAGKRIHALPSAPSSAQPGSPASRPL
jgi:hypothetical protein